jgi:succinate dehydrogenase / fumarate reductase, cytochrome b subunit
MPDLTAKKKRPLWYNLSPLNLPLPGLVSILHRVSGAMLFLALVWFLFLLDMSLGSEAGFARSRAYVGHPLVKLSLLALLWAYLHHFCAGIRYLFLDIDKGVGLSAARASSYAVFAISLVLTALLWTRLW